MSLDFEPIFERWQMLLDGALITLLLSASATVSGFMIGTLCAAGRNARSRISALDPELTGEVLRVIERLAADGMTMVMVTHEMNFARRIANQLVFMHQGRIWEKAPGAFSTPLQTPELQRFAMQEL